MRKLFLLEIEATKTDSSAMGFITYQAAEMLNFYYKEGSNFGKFIIEILEDMSKENKDCHYKFGVLDIYNGSIGGFMETYGYHLGTVEPDIINGSTIKIGETYSLLIFVDYHFNWFQKKMIKWCFGFNVEDYRRNEDGNC